MIFTDFLLNLSIGIIASIIAAVIVLCYTNRRHKAEIKEKYSGPVGEYTGYSYVGPSSINIQLEKPVSHASIKYLTENKLRIELTEINRPCKWSGLISMETESYGSVSWRYDVLNDNPVDLTTHSFGFKRLMYLTIEGRKVVYLVGEEIFGKEILIHNLSV